MKVIYLGTPEFAVSALEALIQTPWVEVLAVCTQPDRPANRGKKIIPPPVKVFAEENNLKVFQTPKISKDEELIKTITDLKPDFLITCAFGQILNQKVLDIAKTLNVHASLLPKYRGAAPINWAILNGDKETGITIMETELSLDSGPMLHQEKYTIEDEDTSITLFDKLSKLGAKSLIAALELEKNGNAIYTPQNKDEVTLAPMLKKEMGKIDWAKSAKEIHNQIRGLQPWPSASTTYNGKSMKVWESRVQEKNSKPQQTEDIGKIIEANNTLKVQTGSGVLELLKVQPENKKSINIKDWLNGTRAKPGDILS